MSRYWSIVLRGRRPRGRWRDVGALTALWRTIVAPIREAFEADERAIARDYEYWSYCESGE